MTGMNRKVIWMIVSWLMVFSLVIAACGPATTPVTPSTPKTPDTPTTPTNTTAPTGSVTPTETPLEKEVVSPETPKYGGVFTMSQTSDPMGFDEAFRPIPNLTTVYMTHSHLLSGDWAKGPAGSGETDWAYGMAGQIGLLMGDLAESYEVVQPDTLIFHIRKGVHWALDPDSEASRLVGGREFTADDAVYSLNRHFLEAKLATMYGRFKGVGNPPKSITALDKYTVEAKVPPELLGYMVVMMGNFTFMWPREVIEKYGDMQDWRNSVGTGAWILNDYVPGSLITFDRNPNFFMTDPLRPENRLPYIDRVQWLIIPDASTRQAGLRTGKIDWLSGLSWEDKDQLLKQRPDMKFVGTLSVSNQPVGRQDKEELPFTDVKVRQALNMAVNQQEILDYYFGGNGELFAVPVPPSPGHAKIFTPLEEQSETVQLMFGYHPDKAKELLVEAGYPDGFKTQIITAAADVDFFAIIREYLLKVGVDMEINVLESGVYNEQRRGRTYAEMIGATAIDYSFPESMLSIANTYDNPAFFNYDGSNAYVNETYKTVTGNFGIDDNLWQSELKKFYPYILEQANFIFMPAHYSYYMWQPWIQGYRGEIKLGRDERNGFIQYIWLDTNLKKSMGY